MHRALFTLIILLGTITPISAQEIFATDSTIIDTAIVVSHTFGGFAGPVFKFTTVNGESGKIIGGHAAFIINNRFGIGIGTYGLAADVDAVNGRGEQFDLYTGSIGLELHYVHESGTLMHWMGTVFMGRAELQLDPKDNNLNLASESDVYFLLSPSVHYELNNTPVLMVNAGIGYNMAIGVDDGLSVSGKDMSGLSISISVALGWF